MVVQLVLNGVDIPCRNARQNMALWALVATKVVKLAQEHAMSTHGADAVTNVMATSCRPDQIGSGSCDIDSWRSCCDECRGY